MNWLLGVEEKADVDDEAMGDREDDEEDEPAEDEGRPDGRGRWWGSECEESLVEGYERGPNG